MNIIEKCVNSFKSVNNIENFKSIEMYLQREKIECGNLYLPVKDYC